jgi:hypothetical protein
MIRFFETRAALQSPIWAEAGWLWKSDKLRRKRPGQLHELRHWHILGACRLWIAWDTDPPRELYQWMKRRHLLGVVVTFAESDSLTIQFAAGDRLQSWMPLAVERLDRLMAAENPARVNLRVRTHWLQEMPPAWKSSPSIHLLRDTELLYVRPDMALSA